MYRSVFILFAVGVALTFSPLAKAACERFGDELSLTIDDLRGGTARKERIDAMLKWAEQELDPSVRVAFEKALRARAQKKEPLPLIDHFCEVCDPSPKVLEWAEGQTDWIKKSVSQKSLEWAERMEQSDLPEIGEVKSTRITHHEVMAGSPTELLSEYYKIEFASQSHAEQKVGKSAKKDSIFRPALQQMDSRDRYDNLDRNRAARRTFAANLVAKKLKVGDLVTETHVVRWKGRVGTLSEWIEGTRPTSDQHLAELVSQVEIDRANILQFLLGNTDAWGSNLRIVDKDGVRRIVSIDLDHAFTPGVNTFRILGAIGFILPSTIPAEILTRIKNFTPKRIRELLHEHLTVEEIDGVIFRREIILLHAMS